MEWGRKNQYILCAGDIDHGLQDIVAIDVELYQWFIEQGVEKKNVARLVRTTSFPSDYDMANIFGSVFK